ncbi:hypothetical protein EJ08DRAFT_679530 [Tothia fuscella]|uniref:Solute carrier family 40 member n=1 Tax=Tothia fuscella TaxID=1048955 RepID=A0A9P4NRB5_9PEZI|nr:hypothetical protein EJ08DRAFT_679530 [Tothia fuscella]
MESPPHTSVLNRIYLSHLLSTWNSRMFEFGAVLFLAGVFPGSLLYASIYALVRALAATVLSNYVGAKMDRTNRLVAIRHSIVWQRLPVALTCATFLGLLRFKDSDITFWICFPVAVSLACLEKSASIANTVAIERDWAVVVAESNVTSLNELNAVLRRMDLICKLVAPVFISLIDSYSTVIAVGVVMAVSTASAPMEYLAIARAYKALPDLALKHTLSATSDIETRNASSPELDRLQTWRLRLQESLEPWSSYLASPVFLASFSLSILYLTVLSTGVQYQTYMLSAGYSGVTVSLLRVIAVILELAATCFAPFLMTKIGPVRSGLWSINWQVIWLAAAVGAYTYFITAPEIAGAALTAGIVISRLGLFGFDLSVQYIVQEGTPEEVRGQFSSSEMALQNLFELLSFSSTVVFPRPQQFRYPVFISFGAVVTTAACFAGFVRQKRGHLFHASKCMKSRDKYHPVTQIELEGDVVEP